MKHLPRIILTLSLLSLLSPLWGQGQRYIFERLKSVRHKFSVNTLAADEHGRLWFSTLGRGAFCYDGYNYFRYKTDSISRRKKLLACSRVKMEQSSSQL